MAKRVGGLPPLEENERLLFCGKGSSGVLSKSPRYRVTDRKIEIFDDKNEVSQRLPLSRVRSVSLSKGGHSVNVRSDDDQMLKVSVPKPKQLLGQLEQAMKGSVSVPHRPRSQSAGSSPNRAAGIASSMSSSRPPPPRVTVNHVQSVASSRPIASDERGRPIVERTSGPPNVERTSGRPIVGRTSGRPDADRARTLTINWRTLVGTNKLAELDSLQSMNRELYATMNSADLEAALKNTTQFQLDTNELVEAELLRSTVNETLFRRTIVISLEGIFTSCQAASRGFVEVAGKQAPANISVLGSILALVPVAGDAAAAISELTAASVDSRQKKKSQEAARRIASLLSTREVSAVAERVAVKLTNAFRTQLRRLASPDEDTQGGGSDVDSVQTGQFGTLGLATKVGNAARAADPALACKPKAAGGAGLRSRSKSTGSPGSQSGGWVGRAARFGAKLIKEDDGQVKPFALVCAEFAVLQMLVCLHAFSKLGSHSMMKPLEVSDMLINSVLDQGPASVKTLNMKRFSKDDKDDAGAPTRLLRKLMNLNPLRVSLSSSAPSAPGTEQLADHVILFARRVDGAQAFENNHLDRIVQDGNWLAWSISEFFYKPTVVGCDRDGKWYEYGDHGADAFFGQITLERSDFALKRGLRKLRSVSPPSGFQRSSSKATKQNEASNWTVDQVYEWILSLNLAESVPISRVFKAQAIDGIVLMTLDQADLTALGVVTFGDRRKILHALKQLQC